jgi:hypothetical protein
MCWKKLNEDFRFWACNLRLNSGTSASCWCNIRRSSNRDHRGIRGSSGGGKTEKLSRSRVGTFELGTELGSQDLPSGHIRREKWNGWSKGIRDVVVSKIVQGYAAAYLAEIPKFRQAARDGSRKELAKSARTFLPFALLLSEFQSLLHLCYYLRYVRCLEWGKIV